MEGDNNNYTRVQQSLEATGLFDEYYEKFKQHQMDDEIMIQLIQDVDLSQNLQRLIPVLGHEMRFKLEFKKLCGDEIPIKLPLHPYLQQELMDYEFLRPDARHLTTSRRGRGRAKSKTTLVSEMKAKTSRKPPKNRTTNKLKSNGSLNTIRRRGRPPKIWPSTVTTSSSSSSSSGTVNGNSSEVNHNNGEDGDMNDCPYSPGPGPNGGTISTSPPIKKPRGRPALKKNKQVVNSFYQRAEQDDYDHSTSPTKIQQQEQQEGSLKAQNSLENTLKRPRGRPPKKANLTKQDTAKKQTNKEVVTERLSGVKYEINNGFPFEHEELEEMPLIHDTARQVNGDEQDFVGSKFDSMYMPILSLPHESTLSKLVDNSPKQKINIAVKSSPTLHARKQIFILKSESESLTEHLRD